MGPKGLMNEGEAIVGCFWAADWETIHRDGTQGEGTYCGTLERIFQNQLVKIPSSQEIWQLQAIFFKFFPRGSMQEKNLNLQIELLGCSMLPHGMCQQHVAYQVTGNALKTLL